MVPTAAQFRHYQVRFPRASGDGPFDHGQQSATGAFPPRERGWSRKQEEWIPSLPVSPARAGMVPTSRPRSSSDSSFPRASGDGPSSAPLSSINASFPPRERGWSRCRGCGEAQELVSPARAGMVPGNREGPARRVRFPRASGDGPAILSFGLTALQFPPRERGWSLGGQG